MKIISYNVNDSYPWKIERILKMDADIFVVPEITGQRIFPVGRGRLIKNKV